MEKLDAELKNFVETSYEQILVNAQIFLDNVKTIDIKILKKKDDPSFAEIAKDMDRVADLVDSLAGDFDPHLAGQALEYVFLMKRMALAIGNENAEELNRLAGELDSKPFVLNVGPS